MAKTELKKDIFRNSMLEDMLNIANEELGYSLKNPNDVNNLDNKTKGKLFLKFYLNEIFQKTYNIDKDLIEQGIVDNANDKGIDFIAIDDDKVYIVQTKYQYKPVNEIPDFINLPESIKTDLYKNTCNAELKAFFSEIKKKKNLEYNLLFVTTEKVTNEEEEYYASLVKNENTQFTIIDSTKLRTEYESIKTMGDNPPDKVTLNLGNEDVIELNTISPNETILITQKGSKLKSLYQNKEYRERLFNLNIRQWLGKNAVNKGMIETLETAPDKFFYYNNGITAICEDFYIDKENQSIECVKFQVVNGAQTLTTIAKEPENIDLSKVKVLIKIVKADKYTSGDKESSLAFNIVKNNNSQTVIKSIDFRSNDAIQIAIENKVKENKLKYPLEYPMAKEVVYKRKRRLNDAKKKTISMENIAKTYYCMFVNPPDVYLSSKKMWDTSENGHYYKIFGVNGQKVNTISDEEFYKLFASYYIYCYIDTKIKNILAEKNKEEYAPYYFKYHIIWGINELLKLKYNNEEIIRIFKQIVNKGYYVNAKINESKEQTFNVYFDKIQRFINSKVEEAKEDTENVAYRSLLTGNKFLKSLERRIKEERPEDLPNLISLGE
ncbi:aIPR protein [Clostridium sp. CAG:306]|nr:aIPR protein [Clostridium sp. CAG:306]